MDLQDTQAILAAYDPIAAVQERIERNEAQLRELHEEIAQDNLWLVTLTTALMKP